MARRGHPSGLSSRAGGARVRHRFMSEQHPDIDSRFSDFIFLQAQNAGFFLGQIPNPGTGKIQINLPAAESVVNALEMLAQKSKGNLSEAESKLLTSARENIRTLFDKAQEKGDSSPA